MSNQQGTSFSFYKDQSIWVIAFHRAITDIQITHSQLLLIGEELMAIIQPSLEMAVKADKFWKEQPWKI